MDSGRAGSTAEGRLNARADVSSVTYNHEDGVWEVRLTGPGNPVISHEKKEVVEDFLDWLENRNA